MRNIYKGPEDRHMWSMKIKMKMKMEEGLTPNPSLCREKNLRVKLKKREG